MTTAAAPARWLARSRRRLGTRTRRAVLIVHIASAGAWLGIDVAMAVFIFTALLTDSPNVQALCYLALEMFAVWSLFVTGMVCLVSGVILGLGTKWGVIRYWWVAVKLALNVILTALVLVALRPEVAESADRARQWLAGGFAGDTVNLQVQELIYPPIVSPIALLIAMTLAVVKPWGRIRRRP